PLDFCAKRLSTTAKTIGATKNSANMTRNGTSSTHSASGGRDLLRRTGASVLRGVGRATTTGGPARAGPPEGHSATEMPLSWSAATKSACVAVYASVSGVPASTAAFTLSVSEAKSVCESGGHFQVAATAASDSAKTSQ